MGNLVRSTILSIILLAISLGVVYVFNGSEVALVNKPVIEVTPENFTTIREVVPGDVVSLTGSLDLLNAVGVEERDSKNTVLYYVPLKEYGTSYVIETKKSKLKSDSQTFTGVVGLITDLSGGDRIRKAMNRPVELSDEDRADLDAETIQALTDQTTNEFKTKTLVVKDGEIPDAGVVYASIAFWGVILFVFLATLLRRYIFRGLIFPDS